MSFIAALFVGAGIALVAYSLSLRSKEETEQLRQLLQVELTQPTKTPEALSEMMERAGAFAERAISKTPSADKLRVKLSQAGSSLKAGEFLTITTLASMTLASLTGLLTGSGMAALLVGAMAAVMPWVRLKSKGMKRLRTLESQLPGVLQLLAGSLDSGASLLLAMELAGDEGDPPLSTEIARVVAEGRVGRPLLESLEAMAERIGSRDIAWTVEAIRIQHQTGGRLADTLRILSDFMRTRIEIREEIRALSAEARFSGKILIGMPIVIGGFLFAIRRDYLDPLISTTMGKLMLSAAVGGMVLGHIWMKKLVQVEV